MIDAPVAVIIAAYNAAETIGASVSSALADPCTGEVIVVDDASTDATAAAAAAADDGSGRLTVIVQPRNAGPSAARNAAIAASTAPLIAILDADDMLLPGRFAALLALPEWDVVADNIVFVQGPPDLDDLARSLPPGGATRRLGLEEFVLANISRRGKARAEMGFLKPVFRRETIERLGLRYDEDLRLGEDFVFYAQALARGARFLLSDRCGYVAIERSDSLSGRHRTADLAALLVATRRLLGAEELAAAERRAVRRHAAAIEVKFRHRRLLDTKASGGVVAALAGLISGPLTALGVIRAIVHDKLGTSSAPAQAAPRRLLFPAASFRASGPTVQGAE